MVTRVNAPWKPGTWFECFDDGCRVVEVETVNNRIKVVKELGLIIPHAEIQDHITSCMKRGVMRHGKGEGYGE